MADVSDDRWLTAHLKDLAEASFSGAYIVCSDFLNEHERGLLSAMEGRLPVCIAFFGAVEEAERQMAFFYPEELKEALPQVEQDEITVLKITPADRKFASHLPTHRDFLGALLGTGIKREKLGDLMVRDGIGYVVVKRDMAPYLLENLTSVGHSVVSVEVSSADLMPEREKGKIFVVSIPSYRLDSVVCRGFKMGRNEAEKKITQGLVSRNGLVETKTDRQTAAGDRITLRGMGVLRLLGEKGMSKSGRIQLEVEFLGRKS